MTRKQGGRARRGAALLLAAALVPALPAADAVAPGPAPAPAANGADEAAQRQAAVAAALAPGGAATPEPDAIPPLPPAPHVFVTGSGEFEINSFDLETAGAGVTVAEEVWQSLERPLELPERGFPSIITVRLVTAAQWSAAVPFQAAAETGGRVTVRVRWSADAAGTEALRHALVQALLMRSAIAWHGLSPALRVPLWLEQGCLGWSLTHTRPALLDEWQQASARVAPPPLVRVLGLDRATPPTRAEELGALWLLAHLQAESGLAHRWPALLRAILGGEDPAQAVGRIYGGDFTADAARELWWQVGWHAQRRLSAQAVETAADSHAWVVGRARWVARRGDTDVVLNLDEVFAARREPWVAAELGQRIGQIKGELGSNLLHPFFRNAALSLGRAYEAVRVGDAHAFAVAKADTEHDYADGVELETAADAALDQLEAAGGGMGSGGRAQTSEVRDQKSGGGGQGEPPKTP